MSTTVPIENIGDSPARKYGQVIQPGEKVAFTSDVVSVYALMEAARDLSIIAKKLSSIESILTQQREEEIAAKLRQERETVQITPAGLALQVETTPWIVRQIQRYRRNRRWEKEMRQRRERNRRRAG